MALFPPPARTEISDTYPNPSNATARTGFGKLWDFVTSLLGSTGGIFSMLAASKLIDPDAVYNLAITFGVNANVLTATVKSADGATALAADNAGVVSFRDPTVGSGKTIQRQVTANFSTAISSGSTAGHSSGLLEYLYWYLIDNGGTIELAWSSKDFGNSGIITTVAEGGAGAADSATVMYSTSVRTGVAFRCVWRSKDTQTTAGLWASVPSEVQPLPFPSRVGNLPAGVVLPYAGATPPDWALACDGSAVSRTTYADLFKAIGTTWGAGNGSTTFNVPNLNGRTLIGDGTGTNTETLASQTAASNQVVVGSNADKWITGMPITVSAASGFTGLVNGSFFVIRIDATHLSFASTLANAQNGTAVAVTGTGVATLTQSLAARTLGLIGGEETHAMSITELLAHAHTYNVAGSAGATPNLPTLQTGTVGTNTTNSTGSNVASNNMQPFATVKFVIAT